MPGTTLLIIDAQKDFHPGGSLAIPTANEDAERVADVIRTKNIDRVVATMDTHQKLHIAHPCFWVSGDGTNQHPAPFTIISADDLRKGIWKPRSDLKLTAQVAGFVDPEIFTGYEKVISASGNLDIEKYCIEYATQLEEKGRFKICIWPEHCLVGSPGHAMVDNIRLALEEWTDRTGGSVEWVLKGLALLTEMYSALEADVPITKETKFNQSLQESLLKSDRLIVCGQAMSHCVNYTLRDIVDHWPQDERSKIILLSDCCSAVPGFEEAAEIFQVDMKAAGVQLMKSKDL